MIKLRTLIEQDRVPTSGTIRDAVKKVLPDDKVYKKELENTLLHEALHGFFDNNLGDWDFTSIARALRSPRVVAGEPAPRLGMSRSRAFEIASDVQKASLQAAEVIHDNYKEAEKKGPAELKKFTEKTGIDDTVLNRINTASHAFIYSLIDPKIRKILSKEKIKVSLSSRKGGLDRYLQEYSTKRRPFPFSETSYERELKKQAKSYKKAEVPFLDFVDVIAQPLLKSTLFEAQAKVPLPPRKPPVSQQYNKGGSVYKQGIGTLARKLQDGGEAKPVFEYGYTPTETTIDPLSRYSKGLLGFGRRIIEPFIPVRRKRLQEEETIKIPVIKPSNAQSVLDFISKETGKSLLESGMTKEDFFYSPRKEEQDIDFASGRELLPKDYRFVFDTEGNPNEGYIEIKTPPVFGKAEISVSNMPLVQFGKKTRQYIQDILTPETRTEALETGASTVGAVGKALAKIPAQQMRGAQALSQGFDAYMDKEGNISSFDPLLVPALSFGAGAVLKAAGRDLTEGGPDSVILGAFIGERKLRDIPDKTKIDGKEVRTIKKDLDKARIEFDRIDDLTASGVSKELKNLGFKSQASMSPALQRKLLEELKVRRPYGWYRGSDGMKRREISDKTTSLDKTEAKRLSENPTKLDDFLPVFKDYAYEVPIENILKGTPLFDAYPDMKGTLVSYKPELEGAYGVYMKGDIDLPNRIAISIDPKKYPHTVKSILLHEVAHQTQYFMRFAGGGNLGFANKVNDRLDNIYQKINILEIRLNLNKGLDPNDITFPSKDISNQLAQLRSETGPLEILLKDWKKLSSDLKKVDPKTNPSQYKNLKEALDYEEEKMYRSVSGEQEARSIQRRDGLTPEERTILSPDIDLGQVIVKELEDQGYTVELPFFSPDLKDSLKVTVTAPDGSNVFPSPVINLTKQLEDILKAERTALYRKSPFDNEQARAKDKLLKLQRIENRTDRQNAELEELNDVLGVGKTMNRADLRTRGEGYNKDNLEIDVYGSDIPFGEDVIRPDLDRYIPSVQAMEKAPSKNLDLSVSAKTARTNTLNTYKKTIPIFEELNKGKKELQKGLDYGSGLGLGAGFLKFDSFDPYLGEKSKATYTKSKKIPSNSYGKITNFNVLNVLPKENRDFVVNEIGRILKKEGHAIISVPDIDYVKKQTRGRKGPEERSIITNQGTYQKHFESKELSNYIKRVLGDDFLVTPNPKKKIGDVSVIIKKFNRGGVVSRGTRPMVFATGIPTALRKGM